MKKTLICAAAAVSLLAGPVHAATIVGLFNTGTDANNVALVGGNGLTDTHWSIVSSTSPGFAGQQAKTYFNGAYAANDANSRWVSLTGNGTPVNNTTLYRLTFDLTGLDATTAAITGRWGVDNSGSIFLNGASTGISHSGFSSLVNFSISSGFVAGLNTLDVQVVDFGVVTAFRVDDLAGTADVASTAPEPVNWAMLLVGFAGLGGALRRRPRTI